VGLDIGQSSPPASLGAAPYPSVHPELGILVTARDEAERLPATLAALGRAFPRAKLVVADDASTDATAEVARAAGAQVVSLLRRRGKGGAATIGARALLGGAVPRLVLLCDGDLGASAAALAELPVVLDRGEADLAVAAFESREGGGFGIALAVAGLVVSRATGGWRSRAPLSGQRALRASDLRALLPFASGFGMEVGMTIDARRAGLRVVAVELPLAHRATGRTAAGFAHRGRQLLDILRAARRRAPARESTARALPPRSAGVRFPRR